MAMIMPMTSTVRTVLNEICFFISVVFKFISKSVYGASSLTSRAR
jgi:hypothetical protein